MHTWNFSKSIQDFFYNIKFSIEIFHRAFSNIVTIIEKKLYMVFFTMLRLIILHSKNSIKHKLDGSICNSRRVHTFLITDQNVQTFLKKAMNDYISHN